MLRYAAALCLGGLTLGLVQAQAGSTTIKIGDPMPAWSNLPGTDGKKHSSSDLSGKDVVVVAITCNHCPVAVAYEDRLIAFTKKYGGKDSKVAVVAINVNNLPQDKLDKMIIRAQQKGFNFTYLYDETQKIGRDLSATVTPEFYVFNKDRKLVYWGSMDNDQDPGRVKTTFLESAVDAALKNQMPQVTSNKPFGCSVKYEKSK